jgi:hypothetical protein
MNSYPQIRKIFLGIYSVGTGLSDVSAKRIFLAELSSNALLRSEIEAAFKDNSLVWRELLFNLEYEVYEADTEEEARSYAMELLCVKKCGNQ